MTNFIELRSVEDQSVNLIYRAPTQGVFESRYVRRDDHYFIVYLSSQSGCDQACRMCHLTATGQTKYENATYEDFIYQAGLVFDHYKDQTRAELVHFNFMARGEAMNNDLVLTDSNRLLSGLKAIADEHELSSKFLISTILPMTLGDRPLHDIFPGIQPEIYYSLYSMNESFRKRWLGKALSAEKGLDMLKVWQEQTGKVPKIHFAFIEGENDSERDMYEMAAAISSRDLNVDLNIVRYNSFSEKYGRESSESVIMRNSEILRKLLQPKNIRIVPKVGHDVKASCGMFIQVDRTGRELIK